MPEMASVDLKGAVPIHEYLYSPNTQLSTKLF